MKYLCRKVWHQMKDFFFLRSFSPIVSPSPWPDSGAQEVSCDRETGSSVEMNGPVAELTSRSLMPPLFFAPPVQIFIADYWLVAVESTAAAAGRPSSRGADRSRVRTARSQNMEAQIAHMERPGGGGKSTSASPLPPPTHTHPTVTQGAAQIQQRLGSARVSTGCKSR